MNLNSFEVTCAVLVSSESDVRWRWSRAACVVTQLSHWHLAMPSSLWCLRNDRSNIGNTLSWGWQYPHPELAKYRKKDLDTKWILLLLENEPVTRLQLLLSFRSPCVFKLWNNLNLLWKDWITAHLTWHHLTISSRFLSWPNKRSSAYRGRVHHSLYLSRGDEMLGDSGHTWSLAKAMCSVSWGWHGTCYMSLPSTGHMSD